MGLSLCWSATLIHKPKLPHPSFVFIHCLQHMCFFFFCYWFNLCPRSCLYLKMCVLLAFNHHITLATVQSVWWAWSLHTLKRSRSLIEIILSGSAARNARTAYFGQSGDDQVTENLHTLDMRGRSLDPEPVTDGSGRKPDRISWILMFSLHAVTRCFTQSTLFLSDLVFKEKCSL